MKTRSVRRFTMDAGLPLRRSAHDEVLEANSPGKVIKLGQTWEGMLQPRIDMIAAEPEPIQGFTLGHVVGAEPAPHVKDMLGRAYTGAFELRDALRKANDIAESSGETDFRDASELYAANEQLLVALGTEEINMAKVRDAWTNRKRAADNFRSKDRRASRATSDANWGTRFLAQSRDLVRSVVQKTRTGSATTRDSQTDIRDAHHAVVRATDQRSQIEALNRLHRLDAAQRSASVTRDAGQIRMAGPQPSAGPKSAADINKANREYWAARR